MRFPFLRRKPSPESLPDPGAESPGLILHLSDQPQATGADPTDLAPAPAEEEPTPAAPAPATPQHPDPVSVSDPAPVSLEAIRARGTPVHWAEGVAVLREACVMAIAAHPDAPRIPDPPDIGITADGTVLLRGGRADSDASRRLARTLYELLATEQIPARLRLFISTSLGSPEPHSIPQFARDLEYFARPDGTELIRALYHRYRHGPATARPTRQVPATPRPARPRKPAARRGRRGAALAVLVALAASAMATWAWVRRDSAGAEAELQNVTARLRDAARDVGTAAGDIARSLGLDLPGLAEDPDGAAGTEDGGEAATAAPLAGAARPSVPTTPLEPSTPAETAVPPAPGPAPATLAPADPPAPQSEAPVAPAPGDEDRAIYSADDAETEPPVMTYPQVPPTPDDGDASTTIELVISAAGEVEEARIVPPARRLTDVMLVSNAKAWRFEPARRNGEPVRYRLRVEWPVTP